MGDSRLTSPREILTQRGQLSDDVIAVKTAGRLADLHTPVSPDAELEPVRVGSRDGLEVIRHSAAHIMADAVQRLFPGTQVTIGPAIDNGFYYDFYRPDGSTFSDADLARIEKEMQRIIKQGRPFVREEVTREQAHAMFEGMGESYKLEILASIPAGEKISLYRHGGPGKPGTNWVDLCEGPHVPSTAHVGVVKLTSVAGAYWRGDEKRPMLQRIYGTAFPSQEELEQHLKMLEEAKARDHRKLGKELELFWFHEYAPAMPFFLPRGTGVYNALVEYIRDLYRRYEYQEVITPQVFDRRLFDTSGHLPNYRENMYLPSTADTIDEALATGTGNPQQLGQKLEQLGLKPMNCPSHCLIFGQRRRSYRELPWRVADFGRLHRYERGGVVHGLARVRTFCQDDAHIFCAPEQIESEVAVFNRLLFEVYNAFEFKDVAIKLALRPEKRIGNDELWDRAEAALESVLVSSGLPFEKLPNEGAFYGPKLEFHIVDALSRSWQLGTIQLDYALPERFDLQYVGSDGALHRPVMLHRAILGSIERFFGMYLEHVAGKFPAWLAPEQATLVTVSEKQTEYASNVLSSLRARGLRVTLDGGADKLGAKIRNARLMRVPYIVVIGDEEVQGGTLSVRSRDQGELGSLTVEQFADRLALESKAPQVDTIYKT